MVDNKLLKDLPFFNEQEIQYSYDGLTKVLNREMITSYVDYLIDQKIPFSVLLSDVDNFKYVNDTYGHMMGDHVLYEVAQTIQESIGENGVVGRYGGDEFMIVLPNINEYKEVWEICHNLNKNMSAMMKDKLRAMGGSSISLTTGVSRYPIDGKNYNSLVDTADKALYRGKYKGRNCFIIYLAEKHANIVLKKEGEASFKSMDMHAKVFELLTHDKSLKYSIRSLLQYLSSHFMIDHVCVQSSERIEVSAIHSLSKNKEFEYIPNELYENIANNIGLFYVNVRHILSQIRQNKLFYAFVEQNISSALSCSIEAYGKVYGVLRADMTSKRVWQSSEMDLFITSARLIGILLHNANTTLEEL